MHRPFDPDAFHRALAEYHFDEAERLLEDAVPDLEPQLREQLQAARERAEEAAQERYRRIVDLGAAGDEEAVAELGKDEATGRLLSRLPKSTRRHAEAYLGAAARWEARQVRISERRLAEARRALEEFDLQLARGLAHRVERRFLPDPEALDRLLLDIESRAMELESFQETERRVSDDRRDTDRGPWWRRRRR